MGYLEFIFSGFWRFIGCTILIYMPLQTLVYVVYYISKIFWKRKLTNKTK